MDRAVAVRALRVEPEARRPRGAEPGMELGHGRMAREAELPHALMREHVPVRRSMGAVAGRAALDSRCRVLEDEGPAFINVAIEAWLLLEAAEQRPTGRGVRIVARNALENALTQPMPLVEGELRDLRAVAVDADSRPGANGGEIERRGHLAQQGRGRPLRVLLVTARAREARKRMRTSIEGRMSVTMAAHAAVRLLERGFLAKRENAVAPPRRRNVLTGIAVTIETTEWLPRARLPLAVIEHLVRPRMSSLEVLDVASVTEPHRLRELGLIGLRVEARAPEQSDP